MDKAGILPSIESLSRKNIASMYQSDFLLTWDKSEDEIDRPTTPTTNPATQTSFEPKGTPGYENLHGVLWTQVSAEHRALCHSVFTAATKALERAVRNKAWTALDGQSEQRGYGKLPPAIIVDVDETVLDNSPYQAWLIQHGRRFSSKDWNALSIKQPNRQLIRLCAVNTRGNNFAR